MRCEHFTMREKQDLGPSFPAELRACLIEAIESLGPSEALAALRREEHAPDNFDGLLAARLVERLAAAWRLRRTERVAEGTGFKNDFSLLGATGAVCVEIEKGQRGRLDLDLIKMLAFAARHYPLPAFGAMIVPLRRGLPRDVSGAANQTAFKYLDRTLSLLWGTHRGNLEDVLVIGYDEGGGTELGLPQIPAGSDENTSAAGPDIVEGTQGLDLDEIARMVGGPRAEVFRRSQALLEIRRVLLQGRAGITERLNRGTVKYLGYHVRGRDRAYVYVQNARLVVDVDVPRTDENLGPLREVGMEVTLRKNYQYRAGWVTGILLPHAAPPEQTAVVAEAIVRALTAEGSGGLFLDPGD